MSSARFLALFLLLPLTALAQNQHASSPTEHPLSWHTDLLEGTALPLGYQSSLLEPKTSAPPLEQLSKDSQASPPTTEATKRMEQIARYLASQGFDPNTEQLTIRVSPQGEVTADRAEICYTMRSYLMARDSKDSDSTHLVGVSTCQPSRQYSLKTTDLHPHPLQR